MLEESKLAEKLKEKQSEVKFTEDELTQVQNIQKSYANVQNQFGQLKMAQIRLDEQEVELEESLKSIQDDEKKFLDGITEKYGEGTLNPETGVFTPTKS
jgi:predicted transcriptional regulator